MEGHGADADDALIVDLPLFVVAEVAAGFGDGAEEGVEGGGAAPFEVVAVFLDLIPEALGIAGGDAVEA